MKIHSTCPDCDKSINDYYSCIAWVGNDKEENFDNFMHTLAVACKDCKKSYLIKVCASNDKRHKDLKVIDALCDDCESKSDSDPIFMSDYFKTTCPKCGFLEESTYVNDDQSDVFKYEIANAKYES